MPNWDCYIIGVQTNASEMIEENENHIATISQCSQRKRFIQKKRRKLKKKMNALKEAHS